MNFDGFAKDLEKNGWPVYGVEVYKQGKLRHAWGDTQGLHEIYSATKSILSIALGIAWDRGVMDFEKPILDCLPAGRNALLTKEQRAVWAPVTLHRLMTMSVEALPFRASGESWLDFSLRCPIPHPEEKVFHYTNICAYLAGVALSEAMGKDAGNFIEENVFQPLGITEYSYSRCPDGYFYGASGMKLSVHSLSQIGLMLLQNGCYAGKRIVSEEYIRKATSALQPCREGGYGYFFWRYRDGFSINGKLKQKCYVLPRQGLVITHLANMEDPSPVLTESLEKHLLGIDAE